MSNLKKKVTIKTINLTKSCVRLFLNKHNENYLFVETSKQFLPDVGITTKYGPISFYCPDELPIWRAETFFEKEPETLEWIDNMESDSVLWDIGANVGCYSLYAGKKGLTVYSFEPSSANYYILNKNISDNNLDSKISAFCLAFSRKHDVAYLNMEKLDLGGAINTFSEAKDEIAFEKSQNTLQIGFRQGMIGFSIDEFIEYFNVEIPSHIKIDVDGLEKDILLGARETLKNKNLKSVLVELDDNESNEELLELFEKSGFTIHSKAHSEMIENSKTHCKIYNYIFTR